MDFNELKMNILAQAEECKNKKDEKDNLTKQLADIVRKNISEIVLPYVNEMNDFLDKIKILAGAYIPYDSENKYFFLGEDVDEDAYKLLWESCSNRINLVFHYQYSSNYSSYCRDHLHNFPKNSNDVWVSKYFYWFGTEKKSLEFVDILKDEYTRILNCWSEHFTVKNKQLAESIKELSDKLSQGSSIQHKEDGTVEIHLGGKTYKATLSEE